jgi:hypothetical protein
MNVTNAPIKVPSVSGLPSVSLPGEDTVFVPSGGHRRGHQLEAEK